MDILDVALPVAFALGFLSGFKHAFEPDHVIAVSTLLHEEPKLPRALRLGLAWGAGHTTMLVGAVVVIGLLRVEISDTLIGYFEIPVAIMLLALGGWALYITIGRVRHMRQHTHADPSPAHTDAITHFHVTDRAHPHTFPIGRSGWQGFAVGLVHGLAGSGALLLLVAATLPSLNTSIAYALVFGLGSVLGMGGVTLALALPLLASRTRPNLYHSLTALSGALSILLGLSILYAVWV